ncbi:MAG: hypothetical protein CMJ52_03605 [Planctomycetaceae bacterium]|nr:hypothetical protein [Planctomycetaceae bacterium]
MRRWAETSSGGRTRLPRGITFPASADDRHVGSTNPRWASQHPSPQAGSAARSAIGGCGSR